MFSIIGITVLGILCIQVFLLCVQVFIKSKKHKSSILLAVMLFFFCLGSFNLVLSTMLSYFGFDYLIPSFQIELLYGIGPSLYLYTKSIINPNSKFNKYQLIHFLPVLLEFIFYRTPIYREGAIYFNEIPVTFFNYLYLVEQLLAVVSILGYTFLSVRKLFKYKSQLRAQYPDMNLHVFRWLISPILIFGIFWILWFTIRIVDIYIFYEGLRHYYYLPMLIVLTTISFWIGIYGYLKSQYLNLEVSSKMLSSESKKKNIDPIKIATLKKRMEQDKLYLDDSLNLLSLSRQILWSKRDLSEIINHGLGINFHEFVNRYRVEAFKVSVQQKNKKHLTLLGHAFESGFSSKSTFNFSFKKYTGITPKEYYNKVQQSDRNVR